MRYRSSEGLRRCPSRECIPVFPRGRRFSRQATRFVLLALTTLFALSAVARSAEAAANCGKIPKPSVNTAVQGSTDYTNQKVSGKLHARPLWHLWDNYESHIRFIEQAVRDHRPSVAAANIVFTLDRITNHYQALYYLARFHTYFPNYVPGSRPNLSILNTKQQASDLAAPRFLQRHFPATPYCYFYRAIHFKPQDPVPRFLYAIYLQLNGYLPKALKQYRKAEELRPRWAELQYNMGLLYFQMKHYKQALAHAKRAYALGYPLPGLRLKLRKVGLWR